MSNGSMRQSALEQELSRVEEEIAKAFARSPPSIARRIELDAMLERLSRETALG
jgi:hypothetical protein